MTANEEAITQRKTAKLKEREEVEAILAYQAMKVPIPLPLKENALCLLFLLPLEDYSRTSLRCTCNVPRQSHASSTPGTTSDEKVFAIVISRCRRRRMVGHVVGMYRECLIFYHCERHARGTCILDRSTGPHYLQCCAYVVATARGPTKKVASMSTSIQGLSGVIIPETRCGQRRPRVAVVFFTRDRSSLCGVRTKKCACARLRKVRSSR